jgi:hypothetical protein
MCVLCFRCCVVGQQARPQAEQVLFRRSGGCILGPCHPRLRRRHGPSKIEAMLAWPTPSTIRALRGFLRLTGYYRKFIRDYGVVARPLTQLLKREAFSWSPAAEEAFQALKTALASGPTLQLPDFDAPFIVNCDASGSGFGAVLHQDGGADRILQQAGGSLARQTGSVRARADRTCQGGAALASVLVEAAVRHAHGPLVPEVPPQPAPIHNSAAYVGKQAFWVCFQC